MKQKARMLRKNMTDAEQLLWRHLRNRELAGYKFRRQKPIGLFIVDFVCVEKSVVVEVDGGQHASQLEADEERSRYLEKKGFRVLRFWNNEVLNEIELVLSFILSALSEETNVITPHPDPLPIGAREV